MISAGELQQAQLSYLLDENEYKKWIRLHNEISDTVLTRMTAKDTISCIHDAIHHIKQGRYNECIKSIKKAFTYELERKSRAIIFPNRLLLRMKTHNLLYQLSKITDKDKLFIVHKLVLMVDKFLTKSNRNPRKIRRVLRLFSPILEDILHMKNYNNTATLKWINSWSTTLHYTKYI